MPGKDREIGEIVELGKNIGRTKVIYEHFIGLRVPADIILSILPITIRGSGRGSAIWGTFSPASPVGCLAQGLSSLSAALLQLVHLAIALSLRARHLRPLRGLG